MTGAVAQVMLMESSGFSPVQRVYNTPGSFTETSPVGASSVSIFVFGASGGSGGGGAAGGGGGSAGGGCAVSVYTITGGATINYTVGNFGAAGGTGGNGGAGGNSSASSGTFTMTTMTGGGGGPGLGNLGAGGTAGVTSGGNFSNTSGNPGTAGTAGSQGFGGSQFFANDGLGNSLGSNPGRKGGYPPSSVGLPGNVGTVVFIYR